MRNRKWRRIALASSLIVLGQPLTAGPLAAEAPAIVAVNSTAEIPFPGHAGVTGVDGSWVVGTGTVDGQRHAFASDLSADPPRTVDLGTLGGSSSDAYGVADPWVVGASYIADDAEYHAFAADLSATEPLLIDLHPDGMVYSGAFDIDGTWAVGEIDDVDGRWWGAAWDLTGATVAAPPEPVKLQPQGDEPWAWARRVSGSWVIGSSGGEAAYSADVAWNLAGASATTPVAPVVLPPLPGGEAISEDVSGHRAVGKSEDLESGDETPVVWDLSATSPTPTVLPMTAGTFGAALAVDDNLVVGYEYNSGVGYTQSFPVVWNLATNPPTEKVLPTFAGPDYVWGQVDAVDGNWVVGRSDVGPPTYADRAFAYNLATDGPMLDLGALEERSEPRAVDGTLAIGSSYVLGTDRWLPVVWNLLAPSPPTLGTPSAGNTSVTLTWTAPAYTAGEAVTGYTLAYQATGDSEWTSVQPDPVTATSTIVGSLTEGTQYRFKVRASTANGHSAYSAEVTATTTTSATVPNAPEPPVAAKVKAGISLNWTDNSNGGATITDHQVRVYKYTKPTKRTPAAYTPVSEGLTGSSSTSHIVTGLTKGTTYVFTVAATNSVGTGGFSVYSNVVRA